MQTGQERRKPLGPGTYIDLLAYSKYVLHFAGYLVPW